MSTQQRINQLVDQLREIGIVVDFTDHPVEFLIVHEDGGAMVRAGQITESATGRTYLQFFDIAQHIRRYVLEGFLANPFGWEPGPLFFSMEPQDARKLREWAEVRDALKAVAR